MIRYVLAIIFVLAVVVGSGALFFPNYWIHRYDALIDRHAHVYRLDEKLVWSIIYEETYFRAWKLGNADEVGLMQVTPAVARQWAKETGLKEFEKQANDNLRQFLSDPEEISRSAAGISKRSVSNTVGGRLKLRCRSPLTTPARAAWTSGPAIPMPQRSPNPISSPV